MAIKTERLYRETHCDFDGFCRDTFGLPRSHCETLVRSTRTAELLMQNGAQIPESCLRPVSKLPDPDLQTAVWRLVEAVSPAQGPTSTLAAKVVRTIKNAIAAASPDGKGPWQSTHKREHPPAELPFLRPLSKIAGWQDFDTYLVVSHIETKERAQRVAQACKIMIGRCSALRTALGERFPEALRSE
jgi:hypothetical protein